MPLLITGGAGFIGSNLIYFLLEQGYKVINLDKLTYAGNLDSLKTISSHANYCFVQGDICDRELLSVVFGKYHPRAVLNLAAESHVDRSIDAPGDFIQTNIVGTFCLLNATLAYFDELSDNEKESFRFLHASTDEVFGSLGKNGFFCETTPYEPSSPYSASKASADHLVRAWHCTYGLPTLTTNCSNNYGPYQFPEKLIPHMILSALQGKCLPVYGDGQNIRDWLYVIDHCRALMTVLDQGRPGETYTIGGACERTNLEVVQLICQILGELCPQSNKRSYQEQITFVRDRPGHDRRYAVDASKIRNQLRWYPRETFDVGMKRTVAWYLANNIWVENILNGSYRLRRLGVGEED